MHHLMFLPPMRCEVPVSHVRNTLVFIMFIALGQIRKKQFKGEVLFLLTISGTQSIWVAGTMLAL